MNNSAPKDPASPGPTVPKPNWNRWLRIGSATCGQAASLTLDCDPDTRNSRGILLVEIAKMNRPEFDEVWQRRANIVIAWICNEYPEAPRYGVPDERFRIPLRQLALLGLIHDWALPPQLDALIPPIYEPLPSPTAPPAATTPIICSTDEQKPQILGDVRQKFWNDSRTTLPTNKEIASYVMNKYQYSYSAALALARESRPEHLRKGGRPRKHKTPP